MQSFALWLKSTELSSLITHYPWVWATSEVFHFIGMSLLFGCIGVLDLRMLGLWSEPAVASVNVLIRWGILGFVINAVTGAIFLVGEPLQYASNTTFFYKMLLIAMAGCNVAIFYISGIADQVESLDPHDEAPLAAKAIAATSLVLWIGVMFLGRMLPFWGNSF